MLNLISPFVHGSILQTLEKPIMSCVFAVLVDFIVGSAGQCGDAGAHFLRRLGYFLICSLVVLGDLPKALTELMGLGSDMVLDVRRLLDEQRGHAGFPLADEFDEALQPDIKAFEVGLLANPDGVGFGAEPIGCQCELTEQDW